jgi:hypothetical protein
MNYLVEEKVAAKESLQTTFIIRAGTLLIENGLTE